MKVDKVKYIRAKDVITKIATGKAVYFGKMRGEASINQAKKESARLQMAEDGGDLGRGSLRVAKK